MNQVKNLVVMLTVVSLLIASCNSKPQGPASNTVTDVKEVVTPKWFFKTQIDSIDQPVTQLFLVLKDTIKVTEAYANFHDLTPAEFADKKLPKETIIACTGFWAGLEQNYILIDSSNNWVVRCKYIDEGSDGKEVFESVATYKK